MAAKKKTVRRTSPSSRRAGARTRLAKRWREARKALEHGRSALGERARALAHTRGVDLDEAAGRLAALGTRLGRERKKAARRVEQRLLVVRARAQQERGAIARRAEAALRRALVALDLPSRQELRTLTRRVEELAGRIDALQPAAHRRAPSRPGGRRR
jgi:polyhydroxyalkanoate synthesis regulator phasin